jgi:type I restriction enzyme S subunit
VYLDDKICKIDARIAVLEKQQNAYARLKKSVIHQAVTRGLNPNVSLKDSGVEWIGMIPEHWELHRFKSIFTECKSVTETGQEDLLSVSEYYGVARRIDKMEDGEYESRADSLVGYKVCKKDDLVINIMLAWKRGLGFSDFDGIVSPAYAVYRGKNIAPHYFHYLMRTDMYVAEYKRNSKGIIDSRLRMYTDRFNNIMAIVPPLSEQQAIAAYLDEKCSEIDAATENIGKQIDAMKRLKRALINEVVTGQRAI